MFMECNFISDDNEFNFRLRILIFMQKESPEI